MLQGRSWAGVDIPILSVEAAEHEAPSGGSGRGPGPQGWEAFPVTPHGEQGSLGPPEGPRDVSTSQRGTRQVSKTEGRGRPAARRLGKASTAPGAGRDLGAPLL